MPRTPEATSSPLSIPPLCPSLAMWGVWCGGHPAQLLCSGTRVWGSSCPSSAAQTGLHALPSPVHVSCGARGCRWGRFCYRSDCPSAGCAMLAPEHWAGTRARVVMLGLAKLLHWGQFCQGCGVLEWLGWVDFAAGGTGAAGFGGAMQCWGGWARLGLARVGPALRAQGCSALGLAVSLLAQVGLGLTCCGIWLQWDWLCWAQGCPAPGVVLLGLAEVGLELSCTGGSCVGFGQFCRGWWCRCCGGPGCDCFCSHCLGAL